MGLAGTISDPVEAGTAGRFFDDLDITSGKGDGEEKDNARRKIRTTKTFIFNR